MKGLSIDTVDITTEGCAQAVAEAAKLAAWTYKADGREKFPQNFQILNNLNEEALFTKGLVVGEAQNLARELMELPSNMLTPTIFADRAKDELENLGVKVNIYDSDQSLEKI